MALKPSMLHDVIILTISLSILPVGTALAQSTNEATDARTLDAISVTGSRITLPGVETSSPVASIERNEFLTSQPVAVEAFLKEFPALTPSIGAATNYEPGGGATINMRGLGDNRTLVLVDGRRPVPFSLDGVVDTNTIPMALLQSVEMLTGGASVVYGADAVAGVTNFLLRRDFEGVEARLDWGQSKYNDGGRRKYEVTFGALSDDGRANAVLSVGYTQADAVPQGNRPWSQQPMSSVTGRAGGSGTTIPSRVNVAGAGMGTRQVDVDSGMLVPTYQMFNYAPHSLYQTALDRWQASGLGRYEFNRHAEAYAQMSYTRSQVGAQQTSSGIFLDTLDIPLANGYMPQGMRQQICNELGFTATECASGKIDPGNSYDPRYVSVDGAGNLINKLSIGRRITELGMRINNFDTKAFQTTAGLRGALNDHWSYDSYWSYGESDQLQSVINWGSLSRVRQAANAVSTTECLDPTNNCVPINLFGKEGSITPDQIAFIDKSAYAMRRVEQTNAAFNLNGDLGDAKSPWADYPIGISAGVEYRRMVAATQSDAAFQTNGEIMGLDTVTPDSRGGFTLQEAYVESIIPIVTGRTGAENLSLELGYRHSKFSNTGGFDDNYGSWKYGLTWAPVQSLKLRAMQQRATRAPNISELFQPEVITVDNMQTDPCAGNAINTTDAGTPGTLSWLCAQTGVPATEIGKLDQPSANQVNVQTVGNPRLTPEEADTTTLGLVFTPLDNLSITLDWWNIEIDRAISTPVVQDVVGACYGTAINPTFKLTDMCALIGRNPINGTFNGVEARGISKPLSNSGFIHKTGWDLGLRFGHALPGTLGQLRYALDLSKVTRDDFQATSLSIRRDCLGYYSTSCKPSHELRSNLRVIWDINDLNITLAWRYWGSIEVEPLAEVALAESDPKTPRYFDAYRQIPAYSYFDLGVNYQAPWNATVNLSVNNLFDKKPPIVGGGIASNPGNSGNTFPQWYDALGRYINIGLSFRF